MNRKEQASKFRKKPWRNSVKYVFIPDSLSSEPKDRFSKLQPMVSNRASTARSSSTRQKGSHERPGQWHLCQLAAGDSSTGLHSGKIQHRSYVADIEQNFAL